jgi:UDP-glucose 4-epimerase
MVGKEKFSFFIYDNMNKTVLITGSAGLIGSESVKYFAELGFEVVGIDNNMRQVFFGEDASTEWNKNHLLSVYKKTTRIMMSILEIKRRSPKYFKNIKQILV